MSHPEAKPLSQLLVGSPVVAVHGNPDVLVDGVTHDSRRVEPGKVFVAYAGVNQDVHRFLPDAMRRGAAAAVVERSYADLSCEMELDPSVTVVQVRRARRARSHLACALYGDPSRDLTVVGVTGTDGKTTTSTLIHAILTAAGGRAGLVSTVAAEVGGAKLDTGLHTTTPEPEDLHRYLAEMRDAGLEFAVLEVTSHGLAQDRVTHVSFDVGVITNITHEALEYHRTYERYTKAKTRLFHLVACGRSASIAVLNASDPSYSRLARVGVERTVTYGSTGPADFTAHDIEHSAEGLSFVAQTPVGDVHVRSTLIGSYNVDNMLAAMAVGHAMGIEPDSWIAGIEDVSAIPGRMELVDEGQPFLAAVDFAHTPNALRNALTTGREMAGNDGRVIVVFGCAGLRDGGKRPQMGRAAGELADLTIVTAEDPRTEDLHDIMGGVAAGLTEAGAREGQTYALVADRYRAVRRACAMAGPGDVLIVAGKGHEQSMCFGDVEYPWDDRAALRAALRGEIYGNLPTAS